MTSTEIQELAEEVVTETLELVEETEKRNNSFFKRVPAYEIAYLITMVRELGTSVLNLSKTAAGAERLIALKDAEIKALRRERLALTLEIERLNTKNGD